MPRAYPGGNVFDAAVKRMYDLFVDGHRVVVSFSAGKDSGVSVEICLKAMKMAGMGNGPTDKLDVVMRDEEIMYPGTFEYAERTAARKDEINFHWLIANQPITNVFNRVEPYWWVFDPVLQPEQWVRQPPPFAERIQGLNINTINSSERFPPTPGKNVYSVMGLRTSESARRLMGVHSKGSYICNSPASSGVIECTPIYDWRDEDIWLALKQEKWDYNHAYDVMNRMGVPKSALRIAPPTLNSASVRHLGVAARAWPNWFDKVCKRLKGVRTAAQFGERSCQPQRRYGETWQDCFMRECVQNAPSWIADRSLLLMNQKLKRHAAHSNVPFPEHKPCSECSSNGSWYHLSNTMYNGDPFCLKASELTYVEPDFFRPGSGTWSGGKPTWGA